MPYLKAATLCLFLLACATGAGAAERALVLPLQPAEGTAYDGLGPAVQNVLENLLALNPALEDTYLMRHMRGPFPTAGDLQSYILGKRPWREPLAGAAREGARYVLGGRILPGLQAEIWLLDLSTGRTKTVSAGIDTQSGLVGLRRAAVDFLASEAGLPFPPEQAAKALTPDQTTPAALRTFGRSYGSYLVLSHLGTRAYLDLALSRRAAAEAPNSYLAANMHAWQLYASKKYGEAEDFFRLAVKLDPSGADALDGMAQCALRAWGVEAATPWALRKAKERGSSTGPALSEMHLILGNMLEDAKNPAGALRQYSSAAGLDPASELPPIRLALVRHTLGQGDKALEPLDARLAKPVSPGVKAILLNFKARLHRWTAQAYRKNGGVMEEKKSLDRAVECLKASPIPDLHEYDLDILRLAQLAAAAGDLKEAEGLLSLVKPEPGTDPLLVESMTAFTRVLAGSDGSGAQARACLNTLAERMRACDPAPREVYDILARTFGKLGEDELGGTIRRLGETNTPPANGDRSN